MFENCKSQNLHFGTSNLSKVAQQTHAETKLFCFDLASAEVLQTLAG